MICYHIASPFSHEPQLADILAVQTMYYVVTKQVHLLAVTDKGKNSKILKSMPAPKIKYTGFTSLVSNSLVKCNTI